MSPLVSQAASQPEWECAPRRTRRERKTNGAKWVSYIFRYYLAEADSKIRCVRMHIRRRKCFWCVHKTVNHMATGLLVSSQSKTLCNAKMIHTHARIQTATLFSCSSFSQLANVSRLNPVARRCCLAFVRRLPVAQLLLLLSLLPLLNGTSVGGLSYPVVENPISTFSEWIKSKMFVPNGNGRAKQWFESPSRSLFDVFIRSTRYVRIEYWKCECHFGKFWSEN